MLPSQKPHHHITEDLYAADPFTKYVMSIYQEKHFRAYQKDKTQFEEREQVSELDMEEIIRSGF